MMLINDKNRNEFVDFEIMRMRIKNHIETLLEDVDNVKYLPKKRAEVIDAITSYQSELHDLNEMINLPFDVLVVVEKKKEDEYLTMVPPPI